MFSSACVPPLSQTYPVNVIIQTNQHSGAKCKFLIDSKVFKVFFPVAQYISMHKVIDILYTKL